jgi:hypothetical protein
VSCSDHILVYPHKDTIMGPIVDRSPLKEAAWEWAKSLGWDEDKYAASRYTDGETVVGFRFFVPYDVYNRAEVGNRL